MWQENLTWGVGKRSQFYLLISRLLERKELILILIVKRKLFGYLPKRLLAFTVIRCVTI